MRGCWLIDANMECSVPGLKSTVLSISPVHFIATSGDPFQALLHSIPELTNLDFVVSKPTHSIKHHIETTGSLCPHRLSAQRLRAVKAEFNYMLQLGIIHPSSSSWASPLHLVPKRSGYWHLTGDFQRLNAMMVPDCHPILHNQAFTTSLHSCKTFKLDLVKAYHQIPVNPADIPKSAVTTPFGTFKFLTVPFGLQNAASTFQCFMDEVVRDLDYIDDILMASASPEEHITHLHLLFKQFRQ